MSLRPLQWPSERAKIGAIINFGTEREINLHFNRSMEYCASILQINSKFLSKTSPLAASSDK